jgi:uncharacterized protein (DUF1330 family)
MKQYIGLGMAMLAGIGVGAAVQSLHAQAKPPVYFIAEIDVTNAEGYAKEYAPQAQAMIKAAGGRFLAIGATEGAAGPAAAKVTAIGGEPPKRVALHVWDSIEKIQAWQANPEYVALLKIGQKYAKFRAFAVEGLAQ